MMFPSIFRNTAGFRIPKDYLIGDPDRGFAQHLAVLETGRVSIAAMAVGVAQACLDESLKYAKARLQFGQPIFNFQAVQIHDGYGYMEEYPVSRYYKSVKLL
jgi:alkylation response protein AidB-like acyl-CoA dehydrogenase